MKNIGTGEGVQAYGHGLYFAQAKGVAEGYRKMLSKGVIPTLDKQLPEIGNHISQEAFSFLRGYEDIDSAVKGLRDTANNAPDYIKKAWEGKEDQLKELNRKYNEAAYWIESNKDRLELKRSEGNLYKVDLDVKDEDLLDWDKPLSDQSEKIRENVLSESKLLGDLNREWNGNDLYKNLVDEYGGEKQASEYLNSLGIPGIRYLDGTSRKQGEGTYNYVIFDENLIKILDKNDKPVEGDLPKTTNLQFMPAEGEEKITETAVTETTNKKEK
jgi:hypothetical protein